MLLLWIETIMTSIYLLYVQFSPQMGNIWWRDYYFSPYGAYELMIYPLIESKMWTIEFWDINYFVWLISGIFINIIIMCLEYTNMNMYLLTSMM